MIKYTHVWKRITLLLVLVSLAYLWGQKHNSVNFTLSFVLASAALLMFGRCFGRIFNRIIPNYLLNAGIFFPILIGQWIALFIFKMASPLFYFINPVFPGPFKIFTASWLILGLVFFISRKIKVTPVSRSNDPHVQTYLILSAFGLFGLGVVSQLGADLGPIGLDTHQHISYAQHIIEAGYFPLEARGTGILDNYIKTFHSLIAIWSGFGLFPFAGAYLKIMPYIQFLLPCFALLECLAAYSYKTSKAGWTISILKVAVPTFIFLAFAIEYFRASFPMQDLNGAPRLMAMSTIATTLLIVWIGVLYRDFNLFRLAVFSVPIMGSIALTLNPVLALSFTSFVLPALFVALFFFDKPRYFHQPLRNSLAFIGVTCLGVGFIVFDPFVLNKLVGIVPGLEFLLTNVDLMSRTKAISFGLINPEAIVPVSNSTQKACELLGCVSHILDVAADKWRPLFQESLTQLYPLQINDLRPEERGLFERILWWTFSLFFLRLAYEIIRLRKLSQFSKLSIYAVGTLALGLLFHSFFARIIFYSVEGMSLEGRLLGMYSLFYPTFINGLLITLLCFCLVFSILQIEIKKNGNFLGYGFMVASLIYIAQYLYHYRVPHYPNNWSRPITANEIFSFWRTEAQIPNGDTIMVPVSHAEIDRQHWLLPNGAIAGFLPYARRDYIFNIYLGESMSWNWRDLEKFCQSERSAQELVSNRKIGWVILPAGDAAPDQLVDACTSSPDKDRVDAIYPWPQKRIANTKVQFISFPRD